MISIFVRIDLLLAPPFLRAVYLVVGSLCIHIASICGQMEFLRALRCLSVKPRWEVRFWGGTREGIASVQHEHWTCQQFVPKPTAKELKSRRDFSGGHCALVSPLPPAQPVEWAYSDGCAINSSTDGLRINYVHESCAYTPPSLSLSLSLTHSRSLCPKHTPNKALPGQQGRDGTPTKTTPDTRDRRGTQQVPRLYFSTNKEGLSKNRRPTTKPASPCCRKSVICIHACMHVHVI